MSNADQVKVPVDAGHVGAGAVPSRQSTSPPLDAAAPRRPSARRRLRTSLSFTNISALYIFLALFVLFSLWVPDTFLDRSTWKTLLDNQALTAIVAVGLVIPLSAGLFNLAIGAEVGIASILVAWMLAKQGVPLVPAVALSLIAGGLIGLCSGLLIIYARIDSFIATLGMSSVLLAGVQWISSSQQILNLGSGFQKIGTNELLGITYPVYVMLGIGILVYYVLERTPVGRRVYATGGNVDAARLAGVNIARVTILSFVACGVLAATAGVLTSSRLGTGDPTTGPSFLLPAFAAAFLGSTQFRGGRYNVAGTIVATYVLATGVKGLQLAGAPVWIPDLFNGAALLLAVGLAKYQGTAGRGAAIGRMLRRGKTRKAAQAA